MIVEIHKSSSSMSGTLQYNENKVRAGVASILCCHGVGSTEIPVINRLFEDRERLSLREAQHLSFQMSVNPGPGDDIREERIPEFATLCREIHRHMEAELSKGGRSEIDRNKLYD